MKRKAFIIFISIQVFLFSVPLTDVFGNDIFSETTEAEGMAELSSRIEDSIP